MKYPIRVAFHTGIHMPQTYNTHKDRLQTLSKNHQHLETFDFNNHPKTLSKTILHILLKNILRLKHYQKSIPHTTKKILAQVILFSDILFLLSRVRRD